MEYANILIRPLVSEKATMIKEAANQVVFFVHPEANKIEIARAVEKAFSVKVSAVRECKRIPPGPPRRGQEKEAASRAYKRPTETLAPGR
jgi:large subunit ribosomal protein L23